MMGKTINVLHLFLSLNAGGAEVLARNYITKSLHNNFVISLTEGGSQAEVIKKAGGEVYEPQISLCQMKAAYQYIVEICEKKRINVIILQHPAPALMLIIWRIKKKKPNIQVINYAHSDTVDMYNEGHLLRQPIRKEIIKKSFQLADGTIAISNFVMKNVLRDFRVKPNRVKVIYNGTDFADYEDTEERKAAGKTEGYHFVYVGRLIYQKGVQTIITALDIWKKENSVDNWRLSIIGDGKYKKELTKLVTRLKLTDKISFKGTQTNIRDFILEANIFIHTPAYEEGFGITIIEAMACGCICICGKSGGIPEIIDDGVNGFLVDCNEKSLAAKIKEVLALSAERKKMIQRNAIKKARQFSMKNYARELDAYIANLVES